MTGLQYPDWRAFTVSTFCQEYYAAAKGIRHEISPFEGCAQHNSRYLEALQPEYFNQSK